MVGKRRKKRSKNTRLTIKSNKLETTSKSHPPQLFKMSVFPVDVSDRKEMAALFKRAMTTSLPVEGL